MLEKMITLLLFSGNYLFFFNFDVFVEITTAAASPAEGEVLLLMGEDFL